MERSIDREAFQKRLDRVEKTVDRIASIISGLRLYSKDGDGESREAFALDKILGDCLSLCSERCRARGITILNQADENLLVLGVPTLMAHVIINLINNACDATEPLATKWIEFSCDRDENFVRFMVRDSGTGIPDVIAARMMTPFFTTKSVGHGAGLGLSVAKGIVEDMGGELYYDLVGGHTAFVVRLPVCESQEVRDAG